MKFEKEMTQIYRKKEINLQLKFPILSCHFQEAFSLVDAGHAVTAFRQWMPAEFFGQAEAGIDHFDDHPTLHGA